MNKKIKFIDFCAGIGGGRVGLEMNNFHSIGFSEIDHQAEKTYRLMFDAKSETNYGDLMQLDCNLLPNFDLLIAGFPCQTFSIAGKREGFERQEGQVIYGLAKILKAKKVKYFILENVKGLVQNNKNNTFKTIIDLLQKHYHVYFQVLNSLNFNVPQNRERVYIVGIHKDLVKNLVNFIFPKPLNYQYNIQEFLDNENNSILKIDSKLYKTFIKYLNNKYNQNKFNLKEILKHNYLILDTRQSQLRIYQNYFPTLRKNRHGILYVKNQQLHKLSGYESLLLQGFIKEYALKVKDLIPNNKLLAQAGNAMTVNVIFAIAQELKKYIQKYIVNK